MNSTLQDSILQHTGASSLQRSAVIQSLWSGYGQIIRYRLEDCAIPSVVVKHIRLPQPEQHPRGWNTDISHQRKLTSYNVETAWYNTYSQHCDQHCRVPRCFAVVRQDDEILIILEDLDAAGYSLRKTAIRLPEIEACLTWLAYFHAKFMQSCLEGLWPIGTYWHLATRPDELQALSDASLKKAAANIDHLLNDSPFQTLVHGDAKLANFCFAETGNQVAAVDFQYVGGGCGMKDVAYFLGSCLDEADCEQYEQPLLGVYFARLKQALMHYQSTVDGTALEQDWRALYPVAWADFHRFIKGWSPEHWKINSYSERITRQVIERLQQST